MAKKNDSIDTPVEEDVIVEFDYPEFPFMGIRKTSEQIRAEFQAQFDAEKPLRDANEAKTQKLLDELVALGLSEESARFLITRE